MIQIRFIIFDNLTEKEKNVKTLRFKDEEQANQYIQNFSLYDVFTRRQVTSQFRPFMIWQNTKTGEKSYESLD